MPGGSRTTTTRSRGAAASSTAKRKNSYVVSIPNCYAGGKKGIKRVVAKEEPQEILISPTLNASFEAAVIGVQQPLLVQV